MSDLSDAAPWIAIGAAAAAAAALLLSLAFYLKLRAVRKAQVVLMGTGRTISSTSPCRSRRASTTFIAWSTKWPRGWHGWTGASTAASPTPPRPLQRLRGRGGHRSASLAFLDGARSGVVMSAIQGRDYARIYVKQLDRGRAPVALSPEGGCRASDGPVTYRKAEIRPYRSADEPLLFGLARLDRGADRRTLGVLKRETVFVAEVDGAPAGYVAVERAEEAMRVDQLFVSPEHEAEGIGRQLLEHAEGYAISKEPWRCRSSSRARIAGRSSSTSAAASFARATICSSWFSRGARRARRNSRPRRRPRCSPRERRPRSHP